MALTVTLLQLKQPGSFSFSSGCGVPSRPNECKTRPRMSAGPIATSQWGGGIEIRQGSVTLGGNSKRRGFRLGLGGRSLVVAAAGDTEARQGEVVADKLADEVDPEENSNFPAEFKKLIVDRSDSPNLFLYASGFCVVVLMRDVILQEIASWGINFARIALYISEGATIGLGKVTNVAAEPAAFLIAIVSWTIMAVDDIYTVIVDGAPVRSLFNSLFLSLAVLSIGDAATSKVKGSRSRLVGIATTISLAGGLEFIAPQAVLLSLALLTAFAKLIQNADPVTVIMPATVTLVTTSEPVLQAAALGIFLAVSLYANWRAAQPVRESSEQTASEMREIKACAGNRPLFVVSAITASICISLAARFLYLRSVKWLLLRNP